MLFYGSRYIHHDTTLHKENFWLVRKTSSNCNGYVICPLPPLREQKAFLEGYPRQKKTPWEIKSVLVVVDHPRHHLGEYLGGPSSPSWYNAEKGGGGSISEWPYRKLQLVCLMCFQLAKHSLPRTFTPPKCQPSALWVEDAFYAIPRRSPFLVKTKNGQW